MPFSRNHLFLLSTAILCTLIHPLIATSKTSRLDSLVQLGIRNSIQQRYAEAITIFNKVKREDPRSPIGYFFHAAVIQTQMMDLENYENEPHFLAQVDSSLLFAKKQVRKNKNAWAYFYIGGSYGYLAFYRSKQGKYWKAFAHAKRSVAALEQAVKLDPTLYDAYLGLGTYKYYRSKLSRHLTWLPLIHDEREKGIQFIKLAIDKSKYSNYSAMNGISWILMEEKRFEEGLDIVEPILEIFPESRVFLWAAAKLNHKMENWRKAADYYERILDSFEKQQVRSPINQIACRKNLCEMYLRLGEKSKALAECEKTIQIPLEFQNDKRVAQKLEALAKTCADGFAVVGTMTAD